MGKVSSDSPKKTLFGESLRIWAIEKYGKIADFQRDCGIPYQTIMNVIRGTRRPRPHTIEALERAGFPAYSLSKEENFLDMNSYSASHGHSIAPTLAEEPEEYKPSNFKMVKVLDLVASAGNGHLVFEEEEAEQFAFNNRWLTSKGAQNAKLSIVRVDGDSMEPTLHNEELILVHHDLKPMTGKIHVVRHNGELFVKRLRFVRGAWVASSDNVNYDHFELDDDEDCVVGLAISSMRDL